MNKPFGWYIAGMIFEGKGGEQEAKDFENGLSKDGYEEKAIPLYTHPAELTDEEIEECYWGDGYPDNPRHSKEFAKAILRKAQEK